VSKTRAAFLLKVILGEKLPELGEGELKSPDLSLAFQTIGANESQSIKRVKIESHKGGAGNARSTKMSG
jgi:hypothetical protein